MRAESGAWSPHVKGSSARERDPQLFPFLTVEEQCVASTAVNCWDAPVGRAVRTWTRSPTPHQA